MSHTAISASNGSKENDIQYNDDDVDPFANMSGDECQNSNLKSDLKPQMKVLDVPSMTLSQKLEYWRESDMDFDEEMPVGKQLTKTTTTAINPSSTPLATPITGYSGTITKFTRKTNASPLRSNFSMNDQPLKNQNNNGRSHHDSDSDTDWNADLGENATFLFPSDSTDQSFDIKINNNVKFPSLNQEVPNHFNNMVDNVNKKSSMGKTSNYIPLQEKDVDESDFDIPDGSLTLALGLPSDHSSTTLFEDWTGFPTDFDRKTSSPSSVRKFSTSPTPSSNTSVMASESDDEGFDDIEFPENGKLILKPSTFLSSQEILDTSTNDIKKTNSIGEDDIFDDLELPENGLLSRPSLAIQASSIANIGSRIPVNISRPLFIRSLTSPRPSKSLKSPSPRIENQSNPHSSSPQRLITLSPSISSKPLVTSSISASSFYSPSVKPVNNTIPINKSHLQSARLLLPSQSSSGTKLLRLPKTGKAGDWGDGTELDEFEELKLPAAKSISVHSNNHPDKRRGGVSAPTASWEAKRKSVQQRVSLGKLNPIN